MTWETLDSGYRILDLVVPHWAYLGTAKYKSVREMLPPTLVSGFHDEAAVNSMRCNDLGNTGLRVPDLGLGGAPLGVYGDYPEVDTIATAQEAIWQSISYFDTAPVCGQGKSEEVLGKVFQQYAKVPLGRPESEGIERNLEQIRNDLRRPKNLSEALSVCCD